LLYASRPTVNKQSAARFHRSAAAAQKHFPALDIDQISSNLFLRPMRVRQQCADTFDVAIIFVLMHAWDIPNPNRVPLSPQDIAYPAAILCRAGWVVDGSHLRVGVVRVTVGVQSSLPGRAPRGGEPRDPAIHLQTRWMRGSLARLRAL
jgi:hypothetical protein